MQWVSGLSVNISIPECSALILGYTIFTAQRKYLRKTVAYTIQLINFTLVSDRYSAFVLDTQSLGIGIGNEKVRSPSVHHYFPCLYTYS